MAFLQVSLMSQSLMRTVPVTFEIEPGSHEWDFWDTYIKKGIDWLPTEHNTSNGMNSGNVGI